VVTVVNTFNPDEPLEPILGAAKLLPQVRFFILGNTDLADRRLLRSAPDNVRFTGYLWHDAYWSQLRDSQAIMVLTNYPYSLLAGAQDGVDVRRPLILSRQPALTDYFTKGTVFVDNSIQSIVDAIQTVQRQEHQLTQEIVEFAAEKRLQWEANFQELLTLIEEATGEPFQPGEQVETAAH
jgi:hypothetical protein